MIKKIGDLTLREVIKELEKSCVGTTCSECKDKNSAQAALCEAGITYDTDYLNLEQEVEVKDE